MKTCFIVNPRAGKKRTRSTVPQLVRDFVESKHLDADIHVTEFPGHASLLAEEAVERGCEWVVACGGDGTVNEVAQGLTGTHAVLGILPCGSGNGLARHLGIPGNPAAALELIFTGETRTIDTGIADGRLFINVMGFGFDAVISERFNRANRRGVFSYFKIAATTFLTYRPAHYRITIDGMRLEAQAWLVAIANSSQYGNNAFIAPDAEVDDGSFDLVTLGVHRVWHVPGLAWRLFNRSFTRHPRVTNRVGSRFLIQRADPGLLHTDGEPHPAGADVEVRVLVKSLRVRVPASPDPSFEYRKGSVRIPNTDSGRGNRSDGKFAESTPVKSAAPKGQSQ